MAGLEDRELELSGRREALTTDDREEREKGELSGGSNGGVVKGSCLEELSPEELRR